MVKYIRAIEFIEDYKNIGPGRGDWREDCQYFSQAAGIGITWLSVDYAKCFS